MGSFSIWHWLVVLLVVVLIFGTKKLRNIGSDVGGAVKNFKEAMSEGKAGADEAAPNQEASVAKGAQSDLIEAEFVEVPVKKATSTRKAPTATKTTATKKAAAKPRAAATKKNSAQ